MPLWYTTNQQGIDAARVSKVAEKAQKQKKKGKSQGDGQAVGAFGGTVRRFTLT